MDKAFKPDLEGIVEKGIQLGEKLGTPTLNISIKDKNTDVEEGVYICRTKVDDTIYYSLMHYGPKSIGTKDKTKIFCEIHVFDFDGDLYNKEVRVQVLKKIRNVRQFESEADLKKQIQKDIITANNYLKNVK